MKKLLLLVAILITISSCGIAQQEKARKLAKEADETIRIQRETKSNEADHVINQVIARDKVTSQDIDCINQLTFYEHQIVKFMNFANEDDNRLFFKGDMLNALSKEDWDTAESIRIQWIEYLDSTLQAPFAYAYSTKAKTNMKMNLRKLKGAVGMTDPILIKLMKAQLEAMEEEKWEDVEKIQRIRTSRINHLRNYNITEKSESQTQAPTQIEQGDVTVNQGDTNVTINNERKKKHSLYGTAKILESSGKFGRITPSEGAGLKIFDMMLGN